MVKKMKTFRISERGQEILKELSEQFYSDETDLVEYGLRLVYGYREFISEIRSYTIQKALKYRKKQVIPFSGKN